MEIFSQGIFIPGGCGEMILSELADELGADKHDGDCVSMLRYSNQPELLRSRNVANVRCPLRRQRRRFTNCENHASNVEPLIWRPIWRECDLVVVLPWWWPAVLTGILWHRVDLQGLSGKPAGSNQGCA
jgi:hypothetical protein